MPSVIRADTDQLRAVARQMRLTADQITSGNATMRQSMDALDATWSGSARDRGVARWEEITPKYPPAVERLEHMANELEALAQRLDDAAAVFGGGAGGTGGRGGGSTISWLDQAKKEDPTKIRPAETKMDGVFDLMQGHKNEDPPPPDLQIYQIGENEFAVLIQGSDAFQSGGMNSLFPNAFVSGMGYSTEFTKTIRDRLADLARKHPNANVNLVGYSQGGIEAQNLAGDQSFWSNSGLKMNSISTYGTPNTYNGPGVTNNYDAPGDLVSNYATPLGGAAILYGVLNPMALPITSVTAIHGVLVHMGDYSDGSTSTTRQQMAYDTAPWTKNNPNASNEWVLYDSADDGDPSLVDTCKTGYAVVTNAVSEKTQAAVNTYNEGTKIVVQAVDSAGKFVNETGEKIADATGDFAEGTGKFIGDAKDAVVGKLPGPMQGFFGGLM